METIIERAVYYRQLVITIYKRYETPVQYVLKFIMGFFIFSSINGYFSSIGADYATKLERLPVLLLASVVTAFLPPTWVFMLMWLFITMHLYYLSLELAVILGLLLLLLILFYIRIFPKESYIIVLLLVCFKLKIPYFAPLVTGLFAGIGATGALIVGALIWGLLPVAETLLVPGTKLDAISVLTLPQTFGDTLKAVIEMITANEAWVYTALVFVVAALAVWFVSRAPLPYSMEIGIGVGGLALIIGTAMGAAIGAIDTGVLGAVFSVIISMLLAYLCKFFYIIVDYTGTERVNFQDDDYLYYVKAVPKIK